MGVVVLPAEAFARMLKQLLPPGRLWRLDPDGLITKTMLGAGDELARVSQRGADLIREGDPRTATDAELLPDFEEMLDLEPEGTEAGRQARVLAKLLRRQRYRPVDFQVVLAPLLGQVWSDVVVIELDRAHAIAVSDDREIYRFYVFRDPALGGSYDVAVAQAQLDDMKPSHTRGHVIESANFLCDDPFSLCDRDILGV